MKNQIKILQLVSLFAVSALAGLSLRANPVTVTDLGMSSDDTVNIASSALGTVNGYAGLVNLSLTASGQTTDTVGLCIDPWHLSVGGAQSYNTEALASAPKVEGPMGSAAANAIARLWARYMTSSYALSANAQTADAWSAALQLEVWQTVAAAIATPGVTYSLNSVSDGFSGEAAAVASDQAAMAAYLAANPDAGAASLIALTGSVGQDYVVANAPDGGLTLLFVALGLAGAAVLRRKTFLPVVLHT